MSKLLQNILKNKNTQRLVEFDLTKSGSAMQRYLGQTYPYDEGENLPIEAESSSWIQTVGSEGQNVIQKSYELHNSRFLIYFLNEVIKLSDDLYHHPEIMINHTRVTIVLYTRDLNDVTDRDLEMSKKIDEINEDITIINFRK